MLAIIARLEINPDHVEDYVKAAVPGVALTREEKGCHLYSFSRDICEDNIIWICEQWESDEDLDAHLQSDHIREFLEATKNMEVLSMDARKYEVSSVGTVVPPEH